MALRLRVALALVICALLSASTLRAQSKRPEDLAVGKLLVASRGFPDPNFAESVILLVHYAGDGTVGIIINRQTTLPVSRVLPDLKGASNDSHPVYEGGPVQINVVQALLHLPPGPHDATHLFGNLYLVSQKEQLEQALAARKGPGELRIYLGYCGWGRGQLENEVTRGDWFIFDGSEALVFDSDPSGLWSRMIARTEQQLVRLQRRFVARDFPG